MNKYQDLKIRHLKAQSFNTLPSIRYGVDRLQIKVGDLKESKEENLESGIIKSSSLQPTERQRKNLSISEYSEQQNAKLFYFLTPLSKDEHKNSFFPEIHLKNTAFTERDYTNLMNSINEVISPKGLPRSTVMLEGESQDFSLGVGKIKYFKCYVRGKKTPLTVKIKRRRGKVCLYTSTIIQEPGPISYEKCYYSDYFEVRDASSTFKYDTLYFGIKAFEDSDIKVSLTFGGKITSLDQLKRIKRELIIQPQLEFTDSDEFEPDLNTFKQSSKDFVVENKVSQFSGLSNKASILTERAQNWKNKRQNVLKRKKIGLESKKNKALEKLNRYKVKAELEKARAEAQRKSELKNNLHGSWLALLYFSKSIFSLFSLIHQKKTQNQRAKFLINKVKMIQNAYRAFKGHIDTKDLNLLRCKNSLSLYVATCRRIHLNEICKKLTTNISYTANAHRVFNKFSTFFRIVVRIQRMMRRHLSRKEQVLNELRRIWNFACEHYLFKKGSKIKKERKKNSLKIISIPFNIRDAVLQKYYMKCVEMYKNDTRKLIKEVGNDENKKVFRTALNGMLNKNMMFHEYLPNKRQMEKMIDETIISMDKNDFKFLIKT